MKQIPSLFLILIATVLFASTSYAGMRNLYVIFKNIEPTRSDKNFPEFEKDMKQRFCRPYPKCLEEYTKPVNTDDGIALYDIPDCIKQSDLKKIFNQETKAIKKLQACPYAKAYHDGMLLYHFNPEERQFTLKTINMKGKVLHSQSLKTTIKLKESTIRAILKKALKPLWDNFVP